MIYVIVQEILSRITARSPMVGTPRTLSCDSAQDFLYNQQSYTATITNNDICGLQLCCA